jgi:hypothetical protein
MSMDVSHVSVVEDFSLSRRDAPCAATFHRSHGWDSIPEDLRQDFNSGFHGFLSRWSTRHDA